MKRLIVSILSLFLLWSCQQESLFCDVSFTVTIPEEDGIVAINIDPELPGNYFRNLNTGESYDLPLFVNGKGSVRVLKGVYLLSFDGVAALSDGRSVRVRSAEHSTPREAFALIGDQEEVRLNLLKL